MNIEMTVDMQTLLVEKLKKVLSDTISENLIFAIVCEQQLMELTRVKEENENLAHRNRILMDEVASAKSLLHNKFEE